MKKTEADISLQITCYCPYCSEFIDIYSDLSGQCIDIFEMAEVDLDEMIATCPDCNKDFEVTKLNN